jgi:hypothetical protein
MRLTQHVKFVLNVLEANPCILLGKLINQCILNITESVQCTRGSTGPHLVWGVVTRTVLGACFGAPKVSHEEAASAEVVSKRWPKVPFHGASAF